jgi:hypothetical protein
MQSGILPVPCQYILSLMNFIIKSETFSHSSIHNINTRNTRHLHRPNAKLSCFQINITYAGIKIFNSLPPSLTILREWQGKIQSNQSSLTNSKYSLLLLRRGIFYVYRRSIILFHKIFVKNCVCSCIYDLFCIVLCLWPTHSSVEYTCMCTYRYVMYVLYSMSMFIDWLEFCRAH